MPHPRDRQGRLLFFFPHEAASMIAEVEAGLLPRDRLYGFLELRERGWAPRIVDRRFRKGFGSVSNLLRRYGLNFIDPVSIASIRRQDILVMKDSFCTAATLAARVAGARIVYLDSLFRVPTRSWRRKLSSFNLRHADAVLSYSQPQLAHWVDEFKISASTITRVPYTIDLAFYRPVERSSASRPYVLAVGRDLGRDFGSLAKALAGTGIGLKLVSLPYLLKELQGDLRDLEVFQRIPYAELFDLYAGALTAVVPLKPGITYPSGIRAVLEAMALGVPVIATRTPVLEEYFREDEVLRFSAPGDVQDLRRKILSLAAAPEEGSSLACRAMGFVAENHGMQAFVDPFEEVLMKWRDERP